ncbi:MAG: DNA translocase FtsK, partial [Candidatus Kapaibacterium sp.]
GVNKVLMGDRDPLFADAAAIVIKTQQASTSFLQRRLKIGYSRAARIVDELEYAGVVGPAEGSKPRTVLLESEADLERLL